MKDIKFIDPSPMVVAFSTLGLGDPFVYHRRLFVKTGEANGQQVYVEEMPAMQRGSTGFGSNVAVEVVHNISVAIARNPED